MGPGPGRGPGPGPGAAPGSAVAPAAAPAPAAGGEGDGGAAARGAAPPSRDGVYRTVAAPVAAAMTSPDAPPDPLAVPDAAALPRPAAPTEAAALRAAILAAVAARGPGRSLCPSEIARALAPADWRPLMPALRAAAALLAEEGRVAVTRRGRPVDARAPGGPIRLSRPSAG